MGMAGDDLVKRTVLLASWLTSQANTADGLDITCKYATDSAAYGVPTNLVGEFASAICFCSLCMCISAR